MPNSPDIQDSPIRLHESLRARVAEICDQEGATLNEFINVAVAEKLAHYRHMEWLKARKTPTDPALAEVLRTLHGTGLSVPHSGDDLSGGFDEHDFELHPEPVLTEKS